ncbi:P-loop containing nucleoside triphosphate hydrolase protein [Lyophyllum atratum]|nr:P-loop containing nucleoside triphosphate hydrolase protein [Lyophyllum atratum]
MTTSEPLQESWRILLVGDGCVGKTSLAHRNIEIDPTLDQVYHKDILIEGASVKTKFLDTWPNQACFTRVNYLVQEGQAFIIVYSIGSRYSFEDTVSHCKTIRQAKRDPNVISALIGNKCDLTTEREVSTEEGRALARELDCDFFETSAKTGENLELVVTTLVRRLRSKPPTKIEARKQSSGSFLQLFCCK